MSMEWTECNEKGFVKKIFTNEHLVSSLSESIKNKFSSAERLNLDNVTSSSKIILYYDPLKEILDALALKKGLKIYNHDCFCAFLKEVCNERTFSDEFDGFRVVRNKVNYYGKTIPLSEAEILIERIKDLREKILRKFKEDVK